MALEKRKRKKVIDKMDGRFKRRDDVSSAPRRLLTRRFVTAASKDERAQRLEALFLSEISEQGPPVKPHEANAKAWADVGISLFIFLFIF